MIDSNIFTPGSTWEITATPAERRKSSGGDDGAPQSSAPGSPGGPWPITSGTSRAVRGAKCPNRRRRHLMALLGRSRLSRSDEGPGNSGCLPRRPVTTQMESTYERGGGRRRALLRTQQSPLTHSAHGLRQRSGGRAGLLRHAQVTLGDRLAEQTASRRGGRAARGPARRAARRRRWRCGDGDHRCLFSARCALPSHADDRLPMVADRGSRR